MKLRYVTITGADDSVRYDEMLSLYKQYPFVEWAILFSQSKASVPRYPGWDWVKGLLDFVQSSSMNLSAHLCGKWVRDVLDGNFTFFNDCETWAFQRVQLNLGSDRLQEAFKSTTFHEVARKVSKPIILGGNYKEPPDYGLFLDMGFYPLFDASGGHGKLTKEWPPAVGGSDGPLLCGYAGGLGPDNLQEQIERIAEVVGEADIWIDMETMVRKNDSLDFEKVRKVLGIAENWTVAS